MEEEKINNLINSIKSKIGEESSALISDDLASLISSNATVVESIKNKDKEIGNLKNQNHNLVLANGNLLQQVSFVPKKDEKEDEKEEENKKITFDDIFDEKGNFK